MTPTEAAAKVDQQRLWQRHMAMAKIGAIPGNGVNRQALTPEDIEARRLLLSWVRPDPDLQLIANLRQFWGPIKRGYRILEPATWRRASFRMGRS